jgi:hypothetical protein
MLRAEDTVPVDTGKSQSIVITVSLISTHLRQPTRAVRDHVRRALPEEVHDLLGLPGRRRANITRRIEDTMPVSIG